MRRSISRLSALGVVGASIVSFRCQVLPQPLPPSLTWRSCDGGFECATLRVPRDYERPDDAVWQIPVIRLPVRDAARRRGSLVFNPGGPGVSGVDFLRAEAPSFERLRERYDLVSFDPRGTGASVPAINCLSDGESAEIRNQSSAPATDQERDQAIRLGQLSGVRCREKFGAWLPFVGTENAARDMDTLRAALGDPKLSYVGFSYGTFLGATYAEKFPSRTGRMVLDGAMDPSRSYTQLRGDQAVAIEAALHRFIDDCLVRPTCALPKDAGSAFAAISNVVRNLNDKSFVAPDGRVLSGGRALGLIQSAMYDPPGGWRGLETALGPAIRGDYQPMLELAHSPALMVNPADTQYLAVLCHDLSTDVDVRDVDQRASSWSVAAPLNGAARAWSTLPCRFWPARAPEKPHAISATGAGPILVVGTTHDPATPVGWARALSGQISDARYLEWNGDGHLAYTRAGACVDRIVEPFLLDDVLPPRASHCP